ncbi:MAG: stage 0 sporulation protein [Desulfobacteraceae bacterium 4572_130]|nr:MAG: stage 0 sporulation protein [Desulfobacteraceae bacterium 4572_130]
MIKVVGIKFKPTGKTYDFECTFLDFNIGDKVIVTTEQGIELGTVAVSPALLKKEKQQKVLKQVLRVATENDFQKKEENKKLENKAFHFCQKRIKKQKIKMNLFSVQSTFDLTKLTFFYTADGRVDFRELVKELVKKYYTRIEMRQVGIRNQSKECGGLGKCGREICCTCFLKKFDSVSIKMAKRQNLSLNPTKISGLCGRLMCCLTFEDKIYKELKKKMPRIGKIINTPEGKGTVIRQNILKQSITLGFEDKSEIEIYQQ